MSSTSVPAMPSNPPYLKLYLGLYETWAQYHISVFLIKNPYSSKKKPIPSPPCPPTRGAGGVLKIYLRIMPLA